MDKEFTIRVTGGPPPPIPGAKVKKGGGRGGGVGGKNAALAQQQKRYNMRLSGTTPLDQFRKDVFALFNIPSSSTHHYQVSFLAGFPPKELDQGGKRTVHELGVRANESVIVKFTLNESATAGNESTTAVATASAKQSASSSTSDSPSSFTNGRKKRAAATAAAASFPQLIAAQDAMMKTEQKKKSSTVKSFGGANKRIVATSSSSSPKGKKAKIEGTGYRLSDGKAVEGAASKRKGSSKQQPMFKSEDDIAGKLLSSMGGGGGGNTGKFLRTAMKGAVEKSYEESRAAVRVAAVNLGAFSFEKVKGGTVVDGQGVVLGTAKDHGQSEAGDNDDDEGLGRTLFIVSYSKGLEGRGRYEEQVEIISQDALKGLIEHVYNTRPEGGGGDEDDPDDKNSDGREMLRPVSMAQLSPRVFWSLVYHYNKAEQNDSSANATVETMLQSTMPHLDWSHLDRGGRKRNLSEKARENLRQGKKAALPTSSETGEDGVKAIEEMEESILEAAMPSTTDNDGDNELSERERRARAAMARFGNKGEIETTSSPLTAQEDAFIDDWKLVTPSEDDIDELVECITEAKESDNYNDKDAKAWAADLVDNVRNWRGLANADSDIVLAQLNNQNIQAETVERWIEVAQQRSIEEIMLEILDGDQDALDCLMDKAHSSTPKDLSFWYASPGMLLETLTKGDDEVKSCTWTETDVKRWASRAKIAVNTLPWLDLYLTPV